MDYTGATQPELVQALEQLAASNPGKAAEIAFALAMLSETNGASDEAVIYRQRCLDLLALTPRETQADCATHFAVVGGVGMPEYLHEGVVSSHLGS